MIVVHSIYFFSWAPKNLASPVSADSGFTLKKIKKQDVILMKQLKLEITSYTGKFQHKNVVTYLGCKNVGIEHMSEVLV